MERENEQLELPLDERYRRAQQYQFDLQPPAPQPPRTEVEATQCPHHRNVFVSGCRFCNPR